MTIYTALQIIHPQKDGLPNVGANNNTIQTILTLFFVFTGALSLLMLTIAGFRYTISAGNPEKTANARRQIIYTLAGLVLSALAVTIVNTVLSKVNL